jgi:spermidine synthase
MSQTHLATPVAVVSSCDRAVLAGVALSSFAALLLELALTRLFSVVLFYHFAFLAISIALLGLGAGGVCAYLAKTRLARLETRTLLARLSAVNALLIPVVLEIVLHVPVSLKLTVSNFLNLTEIYLASALPFFITGLQFSILFARESGHIPRLYGADLAGGALACIGIVPLLNGVGGPNTILFAAAVVGVAGSVWAITVLTRKGLTVIVVALLLIIVANHSGRLIDIVYAKGVLRDPSWVEFARWNAISRVEVDRQDDAKVIVIDADASTYIMNADLKQWQGTEWEKSLMSAPPAIVNVLRPHGDYAIIGPGGGVDVLRAVANGSRSVTGIEINPIIANTIMRGHYADYAQHLYERPDVRIHVTDGRSFIRNSKQQFDVVQMTLVDTWASTAAGAFALSENNLYTVEAFREYFEHLKPDGMVAITRWEFQQPREALRVVSVAMEALHEMGATDTKGNFIVVSEGDLDEDGIPVLVLAKRTPFTVSEQGQVKKHLQTYPALDLLYSAVDRDEILGPPGLPEYRPSSDSFADLIQLNDPRTFAARYPYDVSPVGDNTPFFFFTLKLRQFLHGSTAEQGIDWKVNLGVAVLGAVLVISLLAVLAFLVIPLAVRARARQHQPLRLLYFIAVGLGYILVEIAFIQRFVLFLGHPTYALTVVVFLLLLSSGAGSLISRSWLAETKSVWLPIVLIVAALLLYVFILPGLLNALVGLPFTVKLIISGALLIPLGFVMGMPFPTGLRALSNDPSSVVLDTNENAVEWAWAMNAASSVLGSVLAMVVAIQFGLNVTLACGAAAYLTACFLTRTLHPSRA